MKIFVDANIIVSVLNKEYPLFTYTSRIVSLAGSPRFTIFTSPVCLAIAFYFAEKKFKSRIAKQKIALLCTHISITATTQREVTQVLANPAITDFENGLQYYSAKGSNCQCIITEDVEDFYYSDIEVLNSHDFFINYMTGK